MTSSQVRFTDGAGYERYMGTWSRLAGEVFLDWVAPAPALRWLDVGCGSGAFTEMIVERCAPASVHGIDPSDAQIAYARTRAAAQIAQFHQGNAMAQPFPDDTFDVAVMALVIFFVPEPAQGVAEMRRVVCPGGTVAAYAWDMTAGGFPYDALAGQMRALGLDVPRPPSPEASRLEVMGQLWAGAGFEAVETRAITVHRVYADFDDYWTTILGGASVGPALAAMTAGEHATLQARMRELLAPDADGRITCAARANAIKGRVPQGGIDAALVR